MKRVVLMLLAALAFASISFGGVIDFGGSNPSVVVSGVEPRTFDLWGHPVTITAEPVIMGHHPTITQSSAGLGIDTWLLPDESDEINASELLTLTFATPTFIESLTLNKYFWEKAIFGDKDTGAFSINGGDFVNFAKGDASGVKSFDINEAVTTLSLKGNDYALRSIVAAPEPGSFVLLSTALLGCITLFRRRLSRS